MEVGNIDENNMTNMEPPPGFAPLSSSSAPPGFSNYLQPQTSQPFSQHNPQNNRQPRNERNYSKNQLQRKKKVKVTLNCFFFDFLGSHRSCGY